MIVRSCLGLSAAKPDDRRRWFGGDHRLFRRLRRMSIPAAEVAALARLAQGVPLPVSYRDSIRVVSVHSQVIDVVAHRLSHGRSPDALVALMARQVRRRGRAGGVPSFEEGTEAVLRLVTLCTRHSLRAVRLGPSVSTSHSRETERLT